MGIWKEVFLTASGDVSLRNPFVSSKLEHGYKSSALTVSADLRNASGHAVNGVLRAEVDGKQVSQQVSLGAGESRTVSFAPEQYSDRKSTRLNSSHQIISYAVFCLKKKKPPE